MAHVMMPAEAFQCDHHWISHHVPGHVLYWVRVCSICHAPDWDDLDRSIEEEFKRRREMVEQNFQDTARFLVVDYFNDHRDKTDTFDMVFGDTYVVWFSKTLQNWKALVSTGVPDSMYYEVTHDGTLQQTYIDVYRKLDNVVVPDKEVLVPAGEKGRL